MMGDPDLRSDETVIVRTQGVFVKSIPFEGIITNKRIILIDRAKNLLPPKEIPLATVKDVEGGENSIYDPVVTVTVITRTGDTRQMVLTFSGTAGENRSEDRDDWVKTLKENVSASFEQVIRKVSPGPDQPRRRSEPSSSPRIEVNKTPVQQVAARQSAKKDVEPIHPIKKIIENVPSKTPAAAKVPDVTEPGFGTFCSHCGNQVPEGSGFCNRCGSSITPLGSTASPIPAVPDYRAPVQPQADPEIPTIEHIFNRSPVKVPADLSRPLSPEPPAVQKITERPYSPLYDNPPEPIATPEPAPEPAPAVTRQPQKPEKKTIIPRLFSPKELTQTPLNPASVPRAASPPPKKSRRTLNMPGKNVFIAIGVIVLLIVIAVVGVVFVYPMVSGSGSSVPGSATGLPAATLTPVTTSNPVASGTLVIPVETTAPVAPSTGVYAHISYRGSWKGTYGLPAALLTASDSGDRFLEIENATGPVQVTAEKLDGSTRHELVVEIFKNGGLLTTGKTSDGYGKVTVSADATTGVAQAPKAVPGTLTTTAKPVTNVTTVKTTSSPVTNVTTVKTTVPVTNTTTSSK
ncbi:MAG: zinc-ribbon domain-containing protein [Methanoregula sp.]|nr:zinc-ribbon domain-containing protein [Methanoregula sp.]